MFLKNVTPDLIITSYRQLDSQWLVNRGIQLLICDIDNTLIPHNHSVKNKEVSDFIQKMNKAGIQVVIVSNNTKKRVNVFCKDLVVPSYSFALKPLSHTYRKIQRRYGLVYGQIAMLGDQLLTDVLGAKRLGITAILTQPLVKTDKGITRINRRIEKIILSYLKKAGKIKEELCD